MKRDDNPFTDEYLKQELDFYHLPQPYEEDGVKVTMQQINGRCDDYLNKNVRFIDYRLPRLDIDGRLWMSITPMEIQSAYLPVCRAEGVTATGGLGLGYYTLKLMDKDEVESIDVYEKEQRIVDFFSSTFGDREGFEKVNFVVGDVHEKMVGKQYDHVFMDIYQTLLPNEALDDISFFTENNEIKDYHWWGQEKVVLSGLIDLELRDVQLTVDESFYFIAWQETELYFDPVEKKSVHGRKTYKPSNMYQTLYDEKYTRNALELMGRL